MCKYCIVTMDWTPRISYVHTGQYYYYYYYYITHTSLMITYLKVQGIENFCNKNQRAVYNFHSILVVGMCNRQFHCRLDIQTMPSHTAMTATSLSEFNRLTAVSIHNYICSWLLLKCPIFHSRHGLHLMSRQ